MTRRRKTVLRDVPEGLNDREGPIVPGGPNGPEGLIVRHMKVFLEVPNAREVRNVPEVPNSLRIRRVDTSLAREGRRVNRFACRFSDAVNRYCCPEAGARCFCSRRAAAIGERRTVAGRADRIFDCRRKAAFGPG
jgi:hypothetical protein